MKSKVIIRPLSLILILTMLFSLILSGCMNSSLAEKEETILGEITPEYTISDNKMEQTEPEVVEEVIKPGYIKKDVPLYDQRKYTKTLYGPGTVANAGCGITTASMAISYYIDQKITPDILAPHYNIRKLTLQQRMLKALKDFNIEIVAEYYGKKQWSKVYQALEEGHLVISYQSPGLFTQVGHFFLLTGLTEDGKVWVNDPNGMNYKRFVDELKDGYKNGFHPDSITRNGGNYYVLEFTGAFVPFGIKPTPYSHTVTAPL